MKFEIGIIIAIAWLVIRAISRAAKKNKANLQRGGQISNNSANVPQVFTSRSAEAALARAKIRSGEGHSLESSSVEGRSLEQIGQETSRNILDPFLEARSLEEKNTTSAYNEANLVQQIQRAHETGKPIAHQRHKLFDPTKDRHKAERHLKSTSKAVSIQSKPAQPRVQHPIKAAFKSKQSVKQAFIMAEILKRPEF